MKSKAEPVKCAVCSRIIKGRVPKGGDGSVLYPYKHKGLPRGYDYCAGVLIATLALSVSSPRR